jgi:4-hydroxybenzoate polyprenyltransferase
MAWGSVAMFGSRVVRARAGARRWAAVLRLVHPFPSALNALVVAALLPVATRGWPSPADLATLAGAMLLLQCAIGALNDWADRDLDARTKPWKPIPAGLVSPTAALAVAIVCALAGAALAARAGPAVWLVAMAGFAVGVAYDLGLKRTPLSALTYAAAFPLVPIWVWTAAGHAGPALAGVLPVGALLGFGLQLVNALPDADGDAANGVRGTLQWIGVARGRWVAWSALALAAVVAAALAPVAGLRGVPFLPCLAIAAGLLLTAMALYRRSRSERALRLGWSLLAPAAAVLAVGWLASLPPLP